MAEAGPPTALADRDLIERHVARVIVTPQALEIRLNPAGEQAEDPSASEQAPCRPPPLAAASPQVRTAPS